MILKKKDLLVKINLNRIIKINFWELLFIYKSDKLFLKNQYFYHENKIIRRTGEFSGKKLVEAVFQHGNKKICMEGTALLPQNVIKEGAKFLSQKISMKEVVF